MDINQDIMQHLTGDQFNGETALSVADILRYTCMIVNRVTYFLRFMMNYLNFLNFIVLLGSLEKKYTQICQKFFMFIEQYLFFSVKIVRVKSVEFFFSFDFLSNTLIFLSFEFTVITIHAGACVFVSVLFVWEF